MDFPSRPHSIHWRHGRSQNFHQGVWRPQKTLFANFTKNEVFESFWLKHLKFGTILIFLNLNWNFICRYFDFQNHPSLFFVHARETPDRIPGEEYSWSPFGTGPKILVTTKYSPWRNSQWNFRRNCRRKSKWNSFRNCCQDYGIDYLEEIPEGIYKRIPGEISGRVSGEMAFRKELLIIL